MGVLSPVHISEVTVELQRVSSVHSALRAVAVEKITWTTSTKVASYCTVTFTEWLVFRFLQRVRITRNAERCTS